MKNAGRQLKSQNRFRCKVVATAVAACFVANIAYANPTGPVVVNGQVSFARAGSVLSVTNSPSSIINWQQFSIAGGETTRFIQQSAASAVLNRVVGGDPSSILGTLQSNGRVYLINPSGIMFGAGSQIDVAGLVASTLRLSNEDFLAGRMNFVADPAHTAAVVNQGRISASPGGQVYLVGTAVDNQGVITAPNGDIVLAAGNSVRVTDGTGSRLQVEIRAPADSTVNLSEAVYGSRGIYGGLVRNSGTISANSVVRTADGRIVLKSSGDVTLAAGSSTTANGASGGTVSIAAGGTASVSGAVEAKGDAGSGGRVEISGDLTGVFDGARVNASGTTGGGTILVGGDAHGSAIISGGTELPNSRRTFVGRDTELRADAIESGDGGKVIVWADDVTRYYGNIIARGGAQSGNGGFVEVSGHESLIFRGTVDASAPKGLPGRVLLDPKDIIIANGGADAADSASNAFAVNPTGTVTIDESTIETIIVAGTNVTLQANNDITVNEAIGLAASAGTDGTLTLQAGRSVLVNQGITGTDGALVVRANSTVADGVVDANRDAGAAVIAMANGVTINTGSGNITLAMGTGPTTNNTSGDITISNLTTTGNVLISQGGQTAGSSILRTGTSLVTAASVALDVSDAANTTGVIGTTGSRIATTATNLAARTRGGDIFITETNALVVGGAALGGLTGINAGSGNVTLAAGGTVTQTEAITAATLTLEGAGQTFTLNGANNAVTTLDANNSALTALSFKDDSGFDVAGITTTGATTLESAGGTVTQSALISATTLTLQGAGGTFTLNGAGNAITTLDANNTALTALSFKEDSGFAVAGINTTGNTTLESVGGTVTQTAVIAAAGLELLGAGGTYTLNTQVNAVTTLAGNTGTVAFQDNTGFAIGTVNTAGLTATTAATLTSTGTVTQTQPITTPTLTLTGAAGTFTLNGANNAVTTLDANNTALTALSFKEDSGFAVAGINTTGNTTLESVGGTVTQTAVIAAAGLELLGAGGTYTLNTQVNAVTTLAGNTGTVAFQDNTGFAIGTVNTAGLTATTAATLTSTGTVTQTQPITTPTLTLTGAAGTFTLNGANNAVTTLDANNSALTALSFKDDSGFDVAGITTTGATTLESAGGTVTQSALISATTLTLQGAGGTFTLNGAGNAITTLDANNTALTALSFKEDSGFAVAGINTTGNTTLESVGGTVTQTAVIAAAGLELLGAGGTYTLNTQVNAVTTLAGNTGTVAFQDNTGFAIGTVNTAGLTATTAATLTSTGTVTQTQPITTPTLTLTGAAGTFTLNGANNAVTTLDANNTALTALSFKEDSGFAVAGINTTGNTTLESVGGTVTQTAVIAAAGLELLGAGGTYTLNTQVNAVTTLAGNTGTVAFQDNTGFAIGTVNTAGLTATTAATLTSTGTVTQTQPITTPTLTLTGAAGTFTLNGANNAVTTLDANNSALTALAFQDNTGFDVAGINVTGNATLSSTGTVTQSALIAAAGLELLGAGGTYTLNTQVNAVTTLAGNTGTVAFQDNTGFAIGTVNTAGLTATTAATLTSTGTVTQTQPITTPTLTLTGAAGTFTLNGANNAVTTLDANNSALTALSFKDDSGFDVAGITTTGATTLESAGGTVTQSALISATTLTLQGAGGTFTLNGAGNAITTLDANNTALTALSFKEDSGFAVAGINTTGNTTLESVGGTVTQTAVIAAAGLELLGAGGTYTLNTQVNAVTTLAGNTGTVAFQDNTGFAIGTVNTAGLTATTAATLTSTGTVTQTQPITTPTLTLTGAAGTFTLNGANNAVTTLDANNTALTALSFKEDSGFAVAGINTTGNTTLESVGGTVTQTAVIAAAGLELLGAGGTYTLNSQVNAVTTLAGNTGTVAFQDNTGFAIGTVNTAGLTATTAATLTSTGTVTQTQPITTPTLTLTGAAGTFTLNGANNAVTTLDANNSALTALAFQDNTGFDVAGINVTGNATLSSTGTVTQSALIAAAGLELLGAGGTYTLNTQVNAVTTLAGNTGTVAFQDNTGFAIGTVNTAGLTATTAATLTSTGTVTQTQPITTPTLTLTGAAGTFTLNGANNAVTTLDANNSALTALSFKDDSGFDVAGITTTGATTLESAGGTVTQSALISATTLTLQGAGGTFTLNGAGNAITTLDANNTALTALSFKEDSGFAVAGINTTGNTTLESVGGTVTQTAVIAAAGLELLGAGGTYTLNTQVNAVTTLAGNTGTVAFQDNTGFAIGTVNTAGLTATTAATLTSTGTVTQTQPITTPTLTLTGAAGTFTLNGANNAVTTLDANNTALTALSFKEDSGFAVAGINTTGNTTLESVGGTVTQTAVIAAAGLELLGAGGTYTLNSQVNAVTTLAGNTGTVAFQDNTGFAIGTVNTAGLTATTAATLTSTGTVTQTQPITTPTLTLTGAAGTFTLNGANNAVTTLDANNSALTALAFQDNTGFDVAGINATGAVTLDSAGAVTQSAVISGAGTLSKQGSGTLTLSLANTYTGTTTISAGTLSVNSIANVGGGASALGAPTTVANGTIALGAGTLQYTGTGHSSNRVINLTGAGTVDASGSGTLTLSGGITGAAQNLTLTGTGAGVESGVIGTTTGTLTKTGTGTWTLSGANTNTGTTTISAGTLAYGASNVIATGAVTVDGATAVLNLGNNQSDTLGTVTVANGGSITGSGTSSLTSTSSFEMQDGSVSAILAGAGIALNKTTAGTVTLSGANTYTGATTVSAGTLALGANSVLADASSMVVSGGTFDINTRTDTVAGVQLVSGSITGTTGVLTSTSNYDMRSGTASAILAGAVGLDKTTAGTVTLSGANTYGGNTTISAGTLRLGAADVIPDGAGKGNVIVTGTLDLNGFSETINGLSSTGTVDNTAAATTPTLTVGNNNATGTFSGVIQNTAGTLALTKTGAGTLTLSGNNTYSGTTTVNAGTLVAANDNALGSTAGGTNVSSGATLNINNAAIGDETISINGNGAGGVGALTGTGTASLAVAGTLTLAGASRIGTTSGASTLTLGGAVSAGGNMLDITGAGNLTATNALNNFGAVTINSSGSVSLVDTNALTISALNVGTLTAQTLSGDLTLGGNITATGTGDTIVLAAAANFDNSGGFTLAPNSGGGGRWLVYSTSPAGSTEGGLTSAAGSVLPRLYNRTYSSNPPAAISEPGNHLVYSFQPALTVTPNAHTKTYGQNDPAQVYGVTGYITDDGVTDTAVTAGLAGSFGRASGETVTGGPYLINQGTFASNAGYDIATNFNGVGNALSITQAALTAAIANQTKAYGADDPTVGGIGVTLGGLINNPAIVTWNGNVAVDDSALTSSVTSLTRQVGENVGSRNITSGVFSAASGNYSAPTLTGAPTLSITQAALTAAIANQTKAYGADDPTVGGIGVTLGGLINNPAIVTWNGNVAVDDSALTSSVTSLTRQVGENVGSRNITSGVFSAASGNYSAPTLTGAPTLSITQAALTAAIANQTKAYGADDPTVGGIGVTLGGLINNPAIVTWNGNVAVDDSALTSSVTSLTRQVGENVGSRNITSGVFSAASGNYSAPTLTGAPTLSITQAALTAAIANQTKAYGADDPTVGGIGVTLGGLINNPAIVTWNGNVAVDDSALTSSVTSLTRQVGENVGSRNITSGVFSAASGNYSAPTLTGAPTLSITQAALTAAIANQTKAYGADDPTVGGIGVTLGGLINNPAIVTWNGNVAVDDSALTSSVTSLTRQVGENVGSRNITSGVFSAASGNYSAPTLTGAPTLSITQAALTAAIANQTKAYGADDPTVGGIGVTLGGLINNPAIVTWNGNVAVDDSALTSSVTSLTRQVGENVGSRNITSGVFSAASGNYSAPTLTGAPTLSITQAALTAAIANQTKAYGADDPTVGGIGVTLGGLINNPAIVTWNGNVAVDDSALTSSVTSLTRQVGENVGSRNITSGVFSAASGNYSAPTLTGAPTLSITQAALTAAIANQTKAYGADDPTVGGIGVTLGGLINNPAIVTWNGNVAVDDSALTSSVTSLTRQVGENVGSRNITSGVFSAASGNYSAPTLTGAPTLSITQAALTAAIANQTKAYGADDPTVGGIGVTLGGLINNPAIVTWNGNVAVDDSALTSSVTSLTRQVGENVGSRNITSGVFSAASGNYSAPTLTGAPTLSITQAALTAAIANQTKAYGADDPTVGGIGVTLGGLINNPAIVTWNGNVAVDDSALTSSVTSLTRQVGENVGSRNITSGVFSAASGNYSAPTLTGAPTLSITQAALTAAIANQTKAYGADDPTVGGIGVTLGGLINNPAIVTWNGNVAVDDSALTSSVTSLTRQVGENVGSRNITSGVFSAASGNYSAPTLTGAPTLSITQAALTAAIANQTKAYGADDPTVGGIGVTLGGLINNPAIVTWNGNVAVDDSALTSSVTSLTRQVGENVGSRNITSGVFSAASGNYSAPTLTGAPTLSITQAALTAAIANQTKAYGADDPTVGGIGVTLGGLINNPAIVTWNGNVAVDDSALTSSVTSLTRQVGENVGSRNITSGVFSAASGNYSAPTLTGAPTLSITQAALTAAIANQTKAYGADDPTVGGIGVTLGGLINNPAIVTWNGNVAVDDSALTSSVTSLTRQVGENVGSRNITSGVFSAASGNYSAPTLTGAPTLSITQAALTAAIANQTKAYGADDPTVGGIGVTLGGLINNPAIVTWNGNVAVDDSALTSSVTSLTRQVGENVGSRNITSGVFSAASGNYSAPTLTGAPTLSITQAALTAAIANQTKAYGADDPTVGGIGVTLGGLINNPAIVTWNGNVAVDDSALTSSVTSLTRQVGENVGSRNITSGVFSAASGNYSAPTLTGAPTLSITQAALTAAIANQTKAYGADDPTVGGIGVTLGGLINNPAIVTWNGNVAVDDSALTSSVTSLTRQVGENVGSRNITSGVFSAASGNYSAPTLTGAPTLSITQAALTAAIANQTKAYGADDPTVGGIGVTLGGLINNPAIVTWNGNVAVDDSALTSSVTSLTRQVGENVGSRNITSGVFSAASGNYSAPTLTGAPTLSITQAALTAAIANQTKAYGADDPTVGGIGVTLGGLINNPAIVTWNGNVAVDDSALTSSVTSLTRQVGENVGSRNITSGVFSAASGNYSAPTLTGAPTLSITQAALTAAIANQTKAYGADDPTVGGIGVTLGGLINNPAIVTWNGNVAVDDSALTSSVTSLTRQVGENVGSRNITSGVFSAASGNYSAPTLTGAPTLSITQAALTAAIANQTKAYGADDPTVGGIGVTLGGLINNPAIVTWNGNVAVDDSALTSSVTSLTRQVGENVGSRNITSGVFSAASGNYSAPTLTGAPTLSITQAALTAAIANQTKAYGADDPTVGGIGVTLGGLINNPAIVTWNGNVAVDDSALTSSVTSLTRQVGENVGSRNITSGVFSAASGNYSAPTLTGAPTLSITQAALTAAIANQTKAYGADDPTVGGIGVTLGGLINNPAIVTWNGNVAVDDSALTSSVTSLTRQVGENVGSRNITSGVFSAASGNYSAPTLTGAPTLSITQAALTAAIANQTKAYGADDPTVGGIGVTLGGLINNPAIVTWNGNVAVDDSALTSSVTSLTRQVGENVGSRNITSGVFSAASGNYSAPTLTGAPTLSITQAALTAAIANQTKAYGADDPTVGGIGVTLGGLINNPAIVTWNGNVAVDDSALTSSVTSLTRQVGENVGSRNITSGVFSAASGNYSAPTLTGAPTLSITQAALTAAIANQTKAYGADDPTVGGIGVTLGGLINNPAIVTWNGNVAVDDSALTSSVTSLTRQVGENVGSRNITSGVFSAASGNYSAPTLTGAPTLSITQAALTAAIANQTKAYGADDPTVGGIGVTLGGLINNPAIVTWNGNVAVDDSALTSSVTSLTRQVGENVGSRNITSGVFSAASGNYSAPTLTGAPTLSITQAALTAAIANQTKAYGADDPTVGGIGVTLGGLINNPAIVTWNGNVAVDDSALTSSVTSLTRQVGENVGSRNITSGVFSAASGNYSAPTLTGAPTLSITQAALTAAIANQTKAYGADDPTVGGIGVTLGGLINNPAIVTWNGNVAVDDSALTSSVTSLTRQVGENVGSRNITSGVFSAASGNYSAPTLTGAPTLSITQAALTAAIANQTKAYGADDPTVGGIGVTLGGLINNPAIVTWNGNVAVDDSALTSSVTSLTRQVGENVGSRNITSGVFSAASGNYSAPTLTGAPTLSITQAALTAAIANQTKAYGADDPTVGGIGVTLGGLINNPAIVTWNGNVAVDDSALTSSVTSLTRQVGENVGSRNITSGVFSAASGNYSAPTLTGAPTLSITQAALTAAIANQTKAYGADDPTVGGIGVTLGGLINNPAIVTWNGNVAVDDSALTSSVTSLTRQVGENVGSRNITSGVFSAASGNYSAPTLTGAPTLSITQAALTVDLTTNASKNYGVSDPSVNATMPTFTGRMNTSVTDWNGTLTAIDDTAAGNITLASLTRSGGENVGSYNILTGTAGGTAIGNYTPTVNTNGHTLAINPVALTVTANAQSKTYGASDPTLTYNAANLVNTTVSDWNGSSTLISDTVASALSGALSRAAGESVLGSPYAISQGTLAANVNYNIATFTGNNLTIAPAPLSVTADDATRPVSQPNPPFSASYTGFQFGETPAALTGTLSFSTTAVVASPVGSYPITPFGQSSTNYAIAYVDGNLAVTSGAPVPPQSLASNLDAINLVVGGLYQLGDSVAQRSLADCSGVSVWAPWSCGNQNTDPVVLVAAPAVTGAPPLMETGAVPQPASEVAAVPALRPTPELATAPGSGAPKFNDVMTAVMHRDRAAVLELLDLGWWVDRPDSNGLTPLMAAALNGDATMTELLLQRGADPNRRAAGRSVLDYAARGGDSKVIEQLRRAGAR